MFTGIIQSQGTLQAVAAQRDDHDDGLTMTLAAPKLAASAKVGDSISVNGVCLTVVEADVAESLLHLDVMTQTLHLTTLGGLSAGDTVNLEAAMGNSESARFDGHIVLGHVDGVGMVTARTPEGIATRYTVVPPRHLMRYIAPQGSIALDGISLTVASVSDTSFDVAIIPHTAEVTTMSEREVGGTVNIEIDVAARYQEQFNRISSVDDVDRAISASPLDSVEAAIHTIREGDIVVVMDDESRENEGDLIAAADGVTAHTLNVMASAAKGLICLPMTRKRAAALGLAPMVEHNTDNHETAFTVSIDSVDTTTGISAFDRALTARSAASETARPEDFRNPGHMFPLVAKDGGVLERNGHTEATVDLVRLAGKGEVGLCCEIMADDGTMMRRDELMLFARFHGLPIITIAQLQDYVRTHMAVARTHEAALPTEYGDFTLLGYKAQASGEEAVVLVKGPLDDLTGPVLTRLHSQCLTGDAFASLRCDCGDQLHEAMRRIDAEGKGVVVYLEQEGRGIGLLNKIEAYHLQDGGADTVEANEQLGLPVDARRYDFAAAILRDLGIDSVRLLTNNPAKIEALGRLGIDVIGREPLAIPANSVDHFYLETKKNKMGHAITLV